MQAVYRLRQGVRALLAFRETPDLGLAARYLSLPQLALFRQMPPLEQLHALDVLRSALSLPFSADADGRVLDDLTVAALLHDCGKSLYPVRIWQKTLPVLVGAAWPRLFDRLSRRDPKHLLWRAFAVKARHPAWGSELAAQAGTRPRALWLIEHHQDDPAAHFDHPDHGLLVALQEADNRN
jgi:hypothetical protein